MAITVLYVHTNEIYLFDIPRGLDEIGVSVHTAQLGIAAQEYEEGCKNKLKDSIEDIRPDYCMSQNFIPTISQACKEMDTIYLAWLYDSPQRETYMELVLYPTNYLFVFDKAQQKRLQEVGCRNVYHVPLAANVPRLDELLGLYRKSKKKNKKFGGEIAFVGQLYALEYYDDLMENAPMAVAQEIKDTEGKCEGKWYEDVSFYGSLSKETIEFLKIQGDNIAEKYFPYISNHYYYETSFLSRRLAGLERIHALEILAENHDVRLYTKTEIPEGRLQKVKVFPGVQIETELPLVYANTKINLNITLHSIETGVPQRIFDIMGAGGFVLTNYQKELEELFVIGEEIVVFHDWKEMKERAAYYLTHETERMQIANRGYERVKKEHNYHIRLREILRIALMEKTNLFFADLEIKGRKLLPEYDRVKIYVTDCIQDKNRNGIVDLSTYFESEIGKGMYQHFSEVQRLFVISLILKLEKESESGDFLYNVTDYKSLLKKYNLTIFYLRRIEMDYAEESREEIIQFFYNQKISAYAIYILYKRELFARKDKIVCGFYQLTKGTTLEKEAVQLLLLRLGEDTSKKEDEILLCLADYCLSQRAVDQAYDYLLRIKNPSTEIKEFIHEIEGLK